MRTSFSFGRHFLLFSILIASFTLCSPCQSSGGNGNQIVYVTKSGTKYHTSNCRYAKTATPCKLSDVAGRLSPCSICKPPVLNADNSSKGNEPQVTPKTSHMATITDTAVIVYVTKSGTKYHKKGCRNLSKSCIPMSLKDAIGKYSPCSKCNPPTLDNAPSETQSSKATTNSNKSKVAEAGNSVTVYVTKSGTKYHRAGCSSLSKSKIPISLTDAKARYSPCSRCNPPK